MKFKLLVLLILCSIFSRASAYHNYSNSTSDKDTIKIKKSKLENKAESSNSNISIQLSGGTQGIGGDLRYGFINKLSLRLGGNYTPLTYNGSVTSSGLQTNFNLAAKFANFHLLADYAPFINTKGLRLVSGLAYFNQGSLTASVNPTGSINVGNYTLSGADIGNLNLDVSWKRGVAPYLGIGLFKSFPNHFFNVNLDLGTYYVNSPSTNIAGTGLLLDNYKLEPKLNENLRDYKWLPVLQLNLNFKIK
jgi:hypothetical protein